MDDPYASNTELDRLIKPPAIAMLVLTGLSVLAQVMALLFRPVNALLRSIFDEWELDLGTFGMADLAWTYFGLGIAAVVAIGAVKMLQQRSWTLSMAAAILMTVPCLGPCCPFGIPIGVWALVVLLKPEVREVLQRSD